MLMRRNTKLANLCDADNICDSAICNDCAFNSCDLCECGIDDAAHDEM